MTEVAVVTRADRIVFLCLFVSYWLSVCSVIFQILYPSRESLLSLPVLGIAVDGTNPCVPRL
jgi:hypothetical protein